MTVKVDAPHLLQNDVWEVGILPKTGMSTVFGRIKRGGAFVDFMRPTPERAYAYAWDCSSFLLVPWSNRLRDARFRFRGVDYALRENGPGGTAIHGTAREYPWKVERADTLRIEGTFDSREQTNVNFPFPFSARLEVRLEGARCASHLSIKNEGRRPMPAGLGHHPHFLRTFTKTTDEVRLAIPCAEYFPLDHGLPFAGPIGVTAPVDFRQMRELGTAPVDDCLTTRTSGAPIRFCYPESGLDVALDLDPMFENVVVWAPKGETYFAVEPATNANDGFNLYDRGIRGSGVFVLEPGEERGATFSLEVERGSS